MVSREQLLYSETHEWVRVEPGGDGKTAVIGITDFAVEQLRDVVFVELPKVGAKLGFNDEFGNVESVKSVSTLYAPVSGEVLEVNTDLPSHLEWFAADPYGHAWMIRVRLADEADLGQLKDWAAYQRQCAEEG